MSPSHSHKLHSNRPQAKASIPRNNTLFPVADVSTVTNNQLSVPLNMPITIDTDDGSFCLCPTANSNPI